MEERPLTDDEIAGLPQGLLKVVPVNAVRLVRGDHWVSKMAQVVGRGPQIVVRGRRIFWPRLRDDMSALPQLMAILAHELVHVWQYEHGMTLLRYVLRERGRYWYRLDGRPFEVYGYEQQAAMVEDWVRIQAGLKPRWGRDITDAALIDTIPFASPL